MNPTYRSPFYGFNALRRELDRMFDEAVRGREEKPEPAAWHPAADVAETEDAFLVALDLPGVPKEAIEIELHEGVLSVRGERAALPGQQSVHCAECARGRFFRSFTLPPTADTARLEATLRDGVLRLRLPKREETKPRRIDIA